MSCRHRPQACSSAEAAGQVFSIRCPMFAIAPRPSGGSLVSEGRWVPDEQVAGGASREVEDGQGSKNAQMRREPEAQLPNVDADIPLLDTAGLRLPSDAIAAASSTVTSLRQGDGGFWDSTISAAR
jgi:hypothetical protein